MREARGRGAIEIVSLNNDREGDTMNVQMNGEYAKRKGR
jgi:hypothetical protein